MASLYSRTENLDSLKTRRLIVQFPDGTYPAQTSVPIIADTQGTFGFSTVTIDAAGNVIIPGNLEVKGGAGIPAAEAIFIVGPDPTIIGSASGAGANPTVLNLQPQGGRVIIGSATNIGSPGLDVTGTTTFTGSKFTFESPTATLDGSGNLALAGGLTLGRPLFVTIRGQDVSGNIAGTASSIRETITGSQVTGDICGNQIVGTIRGNAVSITGDISGSQVIGNITGSALTIRGDISGSQVQGNITGKASTITGTIEGGQVDSDIYHRSTGILDPYTVKGYQIEGDISDNVTIRTGTLRGLIDDNSSVLVAGSRIYGLLQTNVRLNTNQLQGDISGSVVTGQLTNAKISARNISDDISGSQIFGALTRADISGSRVQGPLGSSVTIPGGQIRGAQSIDGTFLKGTITNAFINGDRVLTGVNGNNITGTITNAKISGTAITGAIEGNVIINDLTNANIQGGRVQGPIAAGQITGVLTQAQVVGSSIISDVSGSWIVGDMSRANLPTGRLVGTFDGSNIVGTITTPAIVDGTCVKNYLDADIVQGTLGPTCYLDGTKLINYVEASGVSGELTKVTMDGSRITGSITVADISINNVVTAPLTVEFDSSGNTPRLPATFPTGVYALFASPLPGDDNYAKKSIYTTAYYGYSGETNAWFMTPIRGLGASDDQRTITMDDTTIIKYLTYTLLSGFNINPQDPTT